MSGDVPEPRPGVPEPLDDDAVEAYLEAFGFQASGALEWRGPASNLSIKVFGHSTIGKHTYYHLDCKLAPQKQRGGGGADDDIFWQCAGRLKHIRKGLHDMVKRELGGNYRTHFSGMPFAHRMRPYGTTGRLEAWCRRLAYCISMKVLTPAVVAATLRFLGVPEPNGGEPVPIATAGTDSAICGPLQESGQASVNAVVSSGVVGDTNGDDGSSDSDLDQMLATLGEAESAFGLGGEVDGAHVAQPSVEAMGGGSAALGAAAPDAGTGNGLLRAQQDPAPAGVPHFAAMPASPQRSSHSAAASAAPQGSARGTGWAAFPEDSAPRDSAGSASMQRAATLAASDDSDDSGGSADGVGMLRLSPPKLLPGGDAAPESKLQAMLRARREKVDPQAMSGRGKLF